MDPEERADFFNSVDRLEPEPIAELPHFQSTLKIPGSITEIFEISNANRRQNKRRKKQQANNSQASSSQQV